MPTKRPPLKAQGECTYTRYIQVTFWKKGNFVSTATKSEEARRLRKSDAAVVAKKRCGDCWEKAVCVAAVALRKGGAAAFEKKRCDGGWEKAVRRRLRKSLATTEKKRCGGGWEKAVRRRLRKSGAAAVEKKFGDYWKKSGATVVEKKRYIERRRS